MTVSPKNLLIAAAKEPFVTAKGKAARLELVAPGGGPNDKNFRASFRHPLPPEIAELMAYASGFRLGSTEVLFTEHGINGFDFLLPDWVDVCADGCGNFWSVEIRPGTNAWGPVWFVCHDPPVMVYVRETLGEFMGLVLDEHREARRGEPNAFVDSHDAAMRVWEAGAKGTLAASLRGSADAALAAFAKSLPEGAEVFDLRGCKAGEGFAWDRFDTNQPVRRASDLMVFGMIAEA